VKSSLHAVYLGGEPENVDLVVGKVYRVMKPQRGDLGRDIRVIDESGEDYLYPASWFAPVELSARARRVLAEAG
jgi:hypothetical protein